MKLVAEEDWEEGLGGMLLKLCLPKRAGEEEAEEQEEDKLSGHNARRNAFIMMLADQVSVGLYPHNSLPTTPTHTAPTRTDAWSIVVASVRHGFNSSGSHACAGWGNHSCRSLFKFKPPPLKSACTHACAGWGHHGCQA